MDVKHTPGRWRIIEGDSVIRIVGNTPVAVTDSKPYYEPWGALELANARLIAAAPDLLAALLEVQKNNRMSATGETARKGWRAARAAIARATEGTGE